MEPAPRDLHWSDEPKRVALELAVTFLVLILEGCFVCVWAAVVWGVAKVLGLLEPHMPDWARTLFRYVEIGFALFILAKLFLLRADVFEHALVRARGLMRWGKRSR